MNVEVLYDHRYLRMSKKETIDTVKSVLRTEKRKIGMVSVVYTNSRRIRTINEKHLHHDYVTDVIAFALEESPNIEAEIYVNLDRARSQAKTYRATFREEARRLLIHGLLHVFGYRDKSRRDKETMRRKEDRILDALRIRKN